jgi:hypothetical protein
VVLAVALASGLAYSSLGHSGSAASKVDLSGGTAWFADSQSGTVSLLDGATESRISVAALASQNDNISAVQSGIQSGSGAYVVDRTAGTVSRIDGATLQSTVRREVDSPGDTSLAVVSNAPATWLITHQGTLAEEVDPLTLAAIGPPQPISGTSAPPIETPDGALWTMGAGGTVYSFDAGIHRTTTHPGGGALVEADGRPVVADTAGNKYVVLDPHSGHAERSFDVEFTSPTAELVGGGGASPLIAAVGSANGDLQVTDIRSGSSAVLAIGDAGRFGAPVVQGDLIFVPDFQDGVVGVARFQGGSLVAVGYVPVGAGQFELSIHNGSVWFDNPSTSLAGVITPDFVAYAIAKVGGNGAGQVVGRLEKTLPAHGVHTPATTPGGTHTKPTRPPLTAPPPTSPVTTPPVSVPVSAPPSATTVPVTVPPAPPAPTISWSPTTVYVDQAVTFAAVTQGAKVFQWTFQGGSPGTVTLADSPSVTWGQPGTYAVTLVTTRNGQSSAPANAQITVLARPTTTTSPATTPHSTTTAATTCNDATQTVDYTTHAGLVVTVPVGCTHARFEIQGAMGGGSGDASGTYNGGGGADIVIQNYPVTPGALYWLAAGQPGGSGAPSSPGTGGPNPTGVTGSGGGSGVDCGAASTGAGGGGESVLYQGNGPTGTLLVIAAGGGGAGWAEPGGDSARAGASDTGNDGGAPGTATGPGTNGSSSTLSIGEGDGAAGSGGDGQPCQDGGAAGGAGGAGLYGGSGGYDSGGGGGSDYVATTVPSADVTVSDGGFFSSLPNAVSVTWS